jgi:DNA invertase Pin-like site-specific DNA recombinase
VVAVIDGSPFAVSGCWPSSGRQRQAQLADCRRYAARQDWVLGHEYQETLKGTRDDRPHYQRLLADVRAMRARGEPVVVVVAALDRFGRKLLERVRSREELKALGVPIHSAREGGEVSDLTANILASVAQEEVERLGRRVSAVRRNSALSGWYFPGPIPSGYRLRAATAGERRAGSPRSVLDVDEERAPYAREAFDKVAAAGLGMGDDAGDLHRRSSATRTQQRPRSGRQVVNGSSRSCSSQATGRKSGVPRSASAAIETR